MSTGRGARPHIPVLLSQVLETLAPRDGETYLDGTFGAGGYSEAILAAAGCRVIALDRDPSAVLGALPLMSRSGGRLTVIETPFSLLEGVWHQREKGLCDGVVLDIGVSSMQLDEPARGFSFMTDGPLDMRMSASGLSAADLLNTAGERDIADILFKYGEERQSRRIAKAIVEKRDEFPFRRTPDLANLVERVIGRKPGDPKHPATRTFQALRIAVNRELDELEAALAGAERILKPGGRLVVVTFHSLEDRIVKDFFNARSGRASGGGSRHLPQEKKSAARFQIVNQRGVTPEEDEVSLNPRARSARLRWGVRTEA